MRTVLGFPFTLIHSAWQILVALIVRPSAWIVLVLEIDPTLSPYFCLAQLTRTQWQHPTLRRLLIAGYGVLPLLIISATLVILWSIGTYYPLALIGVLFGMALGWWMGTIVSVPVGLVAITVACPIIAVAWSDRTIAFIDIATSPHFALLFGVINALVIYVSAILRQAQPKQFIQGKSLLRQSSNFVLAFFASLVLVLLLAAFSAWVINYTQIGWLSSRAVEWVLAIMPAALLGFAAGWRTLSWKRGVSIAAITFMTIFIASGDFYIYGDGMGGDRLIIIHTIFVVWIYLVLFTLAHCLLQPLAGDRAAVAAGTLSTLGFYPYAQSSYLFYELESNLWLAIAFLAIGLTMHWWRPLLFYPFEIAWNALLLNEEQHRNPTQTPLIAWHTALWDELQPWTLHGLDEHLVLVSERDTKLGQRMIEQVSNGKQRWAAQAAQIELDARQLARCENVEAIANLQSLHLSGALSGPVSAILFTFSTISKNIAAALHQSSVYNRRTLLVAVESELNAFLSELTRSNEPYAQRFQPVAAQWRYLLEYRVSELSSEQALRQEIPDPYIVGVPLTKEQSVFVGRTAISRQLEELIFSQDQPPLLLYGQRRMGKTSLLKSLQWMLPSAICAFVVDLQGPVSLAPGSASFLYNLAKAMLTSVSNQTIALPRLSMDELTPDPFTVFDDWLDRVEVALLARKKSTFLLAMDEFESLDYALNKGTLEEHAILGTMRHIIQHRNRWKVLFAGSHTLEEFQRWSSYLINAQVVHLTYLDESEGRQLIERPIENYPLQLDPTASRQIFDLTRGHPYLLQLLCRSLVNLKNEQNISQRHYATSDDVIEAVKSALESGSEFFADIEYSQVRAEDLWLLRQIAQQPIETGCSLEELELQCVNKNNVQMTLTRLIQRELLEERNGNFRFQVELIRRWFMQSSTISHPSESPPMPPA